MEAGIFFWTRKRDAHRFETKVKAENFLLHNYHPRGGSPPRSELEVLYDTNWGRETPQSLSHEEACEYYEMLPQTLENILTLCDAEPVLSKYCGAQVRQADLALQDLLHKIEDVNIGMIDGYRYCKAIQELRRRRRDHKEVGEVMDAVRAFGIKPHLAELQHSLEVLTGERAYAPRMSKELFQEDKPRNLDIILQGLLDMVPSMEEAEYEE